MGNRRNLSGWSRWYATICSRKQRFQISTYIDRCVFEVCLGCRIQKQNRWWHNQGNEVGFDQGWGPKNIQVDQGSEFYNSKFKPLLKKCNIHLYSTYSYLKAGIIERFNRTLKTKMWQKFSLRGNLKWVDIRAFVIFQIEFFISVTT